MRRCCTIVAALGLSLAPAAMLAGPAQATPQDVASTHAYIVANNAFARASEALAGPAQAAIAHLNKKLRRECPDVGAGAPENEESEKPAYEVAGALWSVSYRADIGPIRAFVAAVRPLRWSNAKITRLAQHYASTLQGLSRLPLPHLCADVRAWRESGFKTLPASTLSFDAHTESLEGHTVPQRLLAPYEQPGDQALVAQTTKIETKLERTETVEGFNDWDTLLATLGLPQ
jgi:hypothetical protein